MKIGLDAGHGLNTAGKQTPDGIKEWTLNDKVRDKVVEKLKDYDVIFVFPDNDEGNVDENLTARRVMYVNQNVDAFVSIHHNAYTGTWNNATGVEVYVDKNNTSKDMALAQAIYKNLPTYTGLKGRGIKKANYTVINQNKVPAVLVEGGFMDSRKDYKVITSEEGQDAYARAVAEGLINFLGLQKKVAKKTIDEVAQEVLEGKWGNGADRRTRLTQAGYSYNLVQSKVNDLLTMSKVAYYPKCKVTHVSIVSALNSIGVDSSLANRKKIATKNGINDYRGTAIQNMKMLAKLKAGKLKK